MKEFIYWTGVGAKIIYYNIVIMKKKIKHFIWYHNPYTKSARMYRTIKEAIKESDE